MEAALLESTCKYCFTILKPCIDEGLTCSVCSQAVHARCLKRGSVPGGLAGDLFFNYSCSECSSTGTEKFSRQKITWMEAIMLALYHLQRKSPGLAIRGFFHWRHHIGHFLNRQYEVMFPDYQQKRQWLGTMAGRLSRYNGFLFVSGSKTSINKPAWWTLMYPNLTPLVTSAIYHRLVMERKMEKKGTINDADEFKRILTELFGDGEFTKAFDLSSEADEFQSFPTDNEISECFELKPEQVQIDTETALEDVPVLKRSKVDNDVPPTIDDTKTLRLLDPMCHYNTSLSTMARMKFAMTNLKLTGGSSRREPILSPYSAIYLKPFIRRDSKSYPQWLKLMAELQITVNKSTQLYILPHRSTIDYVYVQPEHIPAVNSLCNQFFWPGIDLTDALQYPDYSCIATYKRLVIGFAFLVPNVKHTESYISFVFTRPNWRRCGIAKFMIYHLIQTSLGKDVTLHVAMDNPALFLYQKFGFKVENVVMNFYDKYYRNDVIGQSRHAFFCRLER